MNEAYEEEVKEAMKESARLPWTPRPTYTTNAQDTTPKGPKLERRGPTLVRRLRRHYYHLSDALGLFLWAIVVMMVSALAIYVYGILPR